MSRQIGRIQRTFRLLFANDKSTFPVFTFNLQKVHHCPQSCQLANLSSSAVARSAMEVGGAGAPQNMDYEGLLKAQGDESVLIIDVREQKEIDETGKLPGSIHIPMGNVATVLEGLPSEQFQKEYQKPKPNKDTKIILSCRAGARSAKVQEEIQKLGYHNAWNYVGGWSEWESKLKA